MLPLLKDEDVNYHIDQKYICVMHFSYAVSRDQQELAPVAPPVRRPRLGNLRIHNALDERGRERSAGGTRRGA